MAAAVGRIYFFNWLNHLPFPEGDICVFKIHSCWPAGQTDPKLYTKKKKKRGYKAGGNKVVVNNSKAPPPPNPLYPRRACDRQLTASQLVHPNGTAREMQ